ncbi:gene transfer agent family protein [Oryzibacter oryziterrae]|uniref:gene transfer agent family protein n=1 Tax=Oryzibacter oryziterrae TaxID=2766474 RepID=UPI001F3AC4C8|nr:gene transfer agent family protein [Oryzibacter oryziterrae]
MTNSYRGEISAVLGGAERVLRLTLGGLAELEEAFGAEDMTDLARRFSSGTLKAADAVKVIGAGLRGAGEAMTNADVAGLHVEGGVAGYVDIVVRLIAATFGLDPAREGERPLAPPAETAPAPSPGTK